MLHKLHILGAPYEMSVRFYELRDLIEMVEMIAQIMSCKDCSSYTNLDKTVRSAISVRALRTTNTVRTSQMVRCEVDSCELCEQHGHLEPHELHGLLSQLASRTLHKQHELR